MRKTTRSITISAVMTALTVVFLYAASVLPMQRLGVVAAASLFGIAAVIEAGPVAGAFVFFGSAIIGWLFAPSVAYLYVLFFGYYPIVKSLAERLRRPVLQWALKLSVFNAALSLLWFAFSGLILNPAILKLGTGLIYPAGNLIFILYDIGLTRLISFYIMRISKHLRKNKE